MEKKSNKVLDIIKRILVIIVVVFAVFVMIFTIVSVNTFDSNERSIFGYKIYVVLSDSMEPEFSSGSLVLSQNVDDVNKLEVGDIITFVPNVREEGADKTVTHRIVAINKDKDGHPLFNTKGDNVTIQDEAAVGYMQVLGQYKTSIPYLGYFFNFLHTTPGYIVCIVIPFMILILYTGVRTIVLFRKYKDEQNEGIREERAALEKERTENEKMLEELRSLKAQLEAKENGGTGDVVKENAVSTEEAAADIAEEAADGSPEDETKATGNDPE